MSRKSVLGKIWQMKYDDTSDWQECLMMARGVVDSDGARRWLDTDTDDIWLDEDIIDTSVAVERIVGAIDSDERIMVWGDYDVDGTTGSAILMEVLLGLGARVSWRIPHRVRDGYGIRDYHIDEMSALGVKLVITTDNGISSGAEVAYAKSLGVDMIVTDHHQLSSDKNNYPDAAVAVCNPQRLGCKYPNKAISGAGVAWRLGHALIKNMRSAEVAKKMASSQLDLVALSTVCDCMALTGENRKLVQAGLVVVRENTRPSIQALCEVAKLDIQDIKASDFGFRIGPRINAAGRMADAGDVVLMHLSKINKAREIAMGLDVLNIQRREMLKKSLVDAVGQVEAGMSSGDSNILVVKGDYHAGVVGLIAGRLVEKYNKPTIVLAMGEDECVGSVRSVDGVDIHAILSECRDLFRHFGGHPAACGLTISSDMVADLEERVAVLGEGIDKSCLSSILRVDTTLGLADANMDIMKYLSILEPYGIAAPEPVFLACGLGICRVKSMGSDGQHLRVYVRDEAGVEYMLLAWNWSEYFDILGELEGEAVDIVYRLGRSSWQGRDSIDMYLVDMRLHIVS